MAYISQETKKQLTPAIKAVLTEYGVRGTISINDHDTLVVTLKAGKVNFGGHAFGTQGRDVNPYWFHEHYTGTAKDFLTEAFDALKAADWFDKSDLMTDYFNTAYYYDINIGKWNKPYEVAA